MQVYRGMDIGTAKPGPDVLKRVPHHMLDIVEPDHQFNVGDFIRRADRLVEEIYSRNKVPLVAGGAAYYLRSFIFGLPAAPAGSEQVRRELKEMLRQRGLPYLHQELSRVDPATADKLDAHDSYRIVRALEVYRTGGEAGLGIYGSQGDAEQIQLPLHRPSAAAGRIVSAHRNESGKNVRPGVGG